MDELVKDWIKTKMAMIREYHMSLIKAIEDMRNVSDDSVAMVRKKAYKIVEVVASIEVVVDKA